MRAKGLKAFGHIFYLATVCIRLSPKQKVADRHRFTIAVPAASERLQTRSLDMSLEAHSRRAERTLPRRACGVSRSASSGATRRLGPSS